MKVASCKTPESGDERRYDTLPSSELKAKSSLRGGAFPPFPTIVQLPIQTEADNRSKNSPSKVESRALLLNIVVYGNPRMVYHSDHYLREFARVRVSLSESLLPLLPELRDFTLFG